VVWAASCHFSLHARNTLIQECVRAFYTGWYTELVTALPTVSGGEVTVDFSKSGHGLELLPGLEHRADAIRRASREVR
jgi:L-alanine-DL-glutamate epimerase-like enolase superfamily enzyme